MQSQREILRLFHHRLNGKRRPYHQNNLVEGLTYQISKNHPVTIFVKNQGVKRIDGRLESPLQAKFSGEQPDPSGIGWRFIAETSSSVINHNQTYPICPEDTVFTAQRESLEKIR